MEPSSRNTFMQRKRVGKDSQKGEDCLGTATASSRQGCNKVQTRSLRKSTSLLVAPPVQSRRPSRVSRPEQITNAANCAPLGLPSSSSTSSSGNPPLDPSTVAQEPLPQTNQIMAKRNTYPTPDSSPKSQTASSSSILRSSNTSPAGCQEVTKRHIERVSSQMSSILESIEATGPRSHALNEEQMEVDPLPGIFCDTTMNSSSTVSDSWIGRGEISDLDPEVITSMDDLDKAFDDCPPSGSVEGTEGLDKDTFLKPENAPMLAVETPKDPVSLLHKPQFRTSHKGHEDTEGNAQSRARANRGGNLAAAQGHKHPKSDSGIGSTQGSPGNAFLFKEYKGLDYEGSGQLFFGELPSCATDNPVEVYNVKTEGSGSRRNRSSGSSCCAVRVSEAVADYSGHHESSSQFDDLRSSCDSTIFHYGEPTPPSSASRSPSTYSPFEARDFPKTKQLSSESVEAIIHHILNPILLDGAFEDFWGLCQQAERRLLQGKICWLRDLEKFLIDGIPAVRSLSSYKAFCGAFLDNCQRALPYIREPDQQRSYDPVYSSAYFIDALHRAKEAADAWTAQKNKVMRRPSYNSQSMSEELDTSRNNKSKLKDSVPLPDMISLECRKRKMPIDINRDEPQAKRALTPSKAIGSAQPRLAIQTAAPLGYYDGYHDALSSSPLQADNVGYPLNPGFDFNTGLLTTAQSGQFSEYTHPSSESVAPTTTAPLPSDVLGDHGVMARHSTRYPQTPTPADANCAGSPAAPTPSVDGPNNNSRGASRRKAPVQAGKPEEEEAPIYYCDQCSREFPRPCDLTKHKKTHERPFKCDDENCKYHVEGFPTNKERERHQNDIHAANSKEWKCIYAPCIYKSKRESNCKQHMEKAHGYDYKRMKRNPRKRPEQPTKPVTSEKKKRGPIRRSSVATPRSAAPRATKPSRSSRPEVSEVTALPRQDSGPAVPTGFDPYSTYHHPHGADGYRLVGPGMHVTPYPNGSPTTDFEPSPATAPMGYDPHMGSYEANHSMIETSDWYPSSQDSGFLDPYFYGQSSAPYDEGVGGDNTAD